MEKIRFWAAIGEEGRVYDITFNMTGEEPTKGVFTAPSDNAKWFELKLAEPFVPWKKGTLFETMNKPKPAAPVPKLPTGK